MNLRQLEYAVAAADTGSFTRAAALVHVAQPSLSQAIARLEAELGTPLFDRRGRRLRPTPAGEALVAAARRVLRDVEVLRGTVAAVHGLAGGRLDLGVPATAAAGLVGELIGRFRTEHPAVSVRIEAPDDVGALERLVRGGQVEVVITDRPPGPGLDGQIAATEEILAVFPPGWSPRADPLPQREVADLPLVLPARAGRHAELSGLEAASRAPAGVETAAREAIIPLVLAGCGVAFLPRAVAALAAAAGATTVPLDPPVTRTLWLVWGPPPRSPAADALIAMVAATAQDPAG